jgi:glycosyltransferase involved in cell wall biosynthesis
MMIAAGLGASLVNFRGHLIRALVKSGVEVHVAAPDFPSEPDLCRTLSGWGVIAHRVPMRRTGRNPFADLVLVFRYFTLLRRVKPDVFLGYTVKPVIYGALGAWLAQVPRRIALITGLGYGFQGGRRRAMLRWIVRNLYKLSLNVADVVIFQNSDDRHDFETLGLISARSRVEVVNGSGIDLELFPPKPLPEGRVTFLMIARLINDKGVREYVQAAELIQRENRNARFVLVGPIDANPDSVTPKELQSWISHGLVEYRGVVTDVRADLADCSVFVLPSYREGTPRAVLEAMATGRAIITTDAPGCRETVDDGVNGFLVPVRSGEAVAVAMRRFMEDPRLLKTMGEASLFKVRTKYDVRDVNIKFMTILGIGDRGGRGWR